MADYTLSAKLTGDASSLMGAFNQAKSQLDSLSQSTAAAGKKLMGLGAGMTAAVTVPFAGAVKTTVDFDSAMRKAGAIAGATPAEFEKMSAAAMEMGATTSLSASEVANAMTEMAAKGFDANQSIAAMPGVIAAAEASGEDLATTADVVTSALNGFQLSADESGRVADVLAMSANKSAAGVADLGYSFKYAAPIAHSLGISMEELAASTGIMVDAGLDGSQAGTTLRMALTRLVKPTKNAQEAMDGIGFSAIDAQGNFKSIETIVTDLTKATAGMTDAEKQATLAMIFGTEAASGMGILMSAGADEVGNMTTALENSEGASAEAAAQMKAGIGGALENLSGAIESAVIGIMSQLTPAIQQAAEVITELVNKFNGMSESQKTIVAFAAAAVAALGPILLIAGGLLLGVSALASAFAFLASPIGIAIAAVGGLVAAFAVAAAKNEEFRQTLTIAWQGVQEAISGVVAAVVPIINGLWTAIQPVIQSIGDGLVNAFVAVAPAIQSGLSQVGPMLSTIFSTIGSVISAVWPAIQGFFTALIDGFSSTGASGGSAIMSLGSLLLGLNPIIKIVVAMFAQMGPQIADFFNQLVAVLGPVLATLGGAIGQIAGIITTLLGQAFASLMPVILQVAQTFMSLASQILPVLANIITTLVPYIMQLATFFAGVLAQVMPLIGVLISALMPVLQTIMTVVMNLITALLPPISAILNVIMSVIQALMPVIMMILTVVVQVISSIITAISPIIAFIGGVISTIISIIAPIVTFIANIIASIINFITPIIQVVAGVFSTVFSIVSSVFRGIADFIGNVINTVSTIISKISDTVSTVFNKVYSVVSDVMGRVGSLITGIFDGIENAWNGLTDFVSGVMDGISNAVNSVVDSMKGVVNTVIDGINGAIGIINKIPGVKIGKISHLQSGTTSWTGGPAYMNEGGRGEMVILPSGAQVIPHDATMAYAKETAKNSGTVVVTQQQNTARIEYLLEQLLKKNPVIEMDGDIVSSKVSYNQADRFGNMNYSSGGGVIY
ncbi:phage tail tape measure protein [Listeria monocytogenes]|nr:phage tail tape measure protein [Listeria monocytogenes]